ncbi:MAG: sensor histidine kinase [Bacteriovoracaceae bacterium]|jgi:two-component system, NtrC family, sensor kinase|nr:sensor histidine kinase [Bacteriovoracaceae bacterium]
MKRMVDALSIRQVLFLAFVATSLIPLVFYAISTFELFKKDIKKKSLNSLLAVTKLKRDKIEYYFNERMSDFKVASNYYNIKTNFPIINMYINAPQGPIYRKSVDMLNAQLRTFVEEYNYEDLMLLNLDGIILYTSNSEHYEKELGKQLPRIFQKYFEKSKKDINITPVFKNTRFNNLSEMYIMGPIKDDQGESIGVMVLELKMGVILNLIEDFTGLGKSGETLIGVRDGSDILFINNLRHESGTSLKKKIKLNSPTALPMQSAVISGSGYGESVDYRNKEVIAVWEYIEALSWGFVAKIDQDEAYSSVTKLKTISIILIGSLIIILIFISLKMRGLLIDPINKLTDKAIALSKLPLWEKKEIKGLNELKILEKTFESMAKKLTKIQNKLINSNVELYDKSELLQEKINELQKTKKQLIQTSKLKALGEMAGGVAHEINNPLTIILATIQLMKKELCQNKFNKDKFFKRIETAEQVTKRIADITNGLRVISRDDSDKELADECMSCILIDTLPFCKARFENSGIDLLIDFDNPYLKTKIKCLKVHISQVLLNLLNNAFDELEKKELPEKKWVEIECDEEEVGEIKYLIVKVIDSGAGIPPGSQEKLFDPFFTTKEAGKGTGIGLSISKAIVENHQGHFFVDNDHPHTCFVLRFPAVA